MHWPTIERNSIVGSQGRVNMIGLYVFGIMVLAGIVALIVVKARWSRQATRKWAIIAARNALLK